MKTSTRMRRALIPVLLLGTLLMAAGCSSTPSGVVVVTMKGKRFNPPVVTIRPGTTVRWVNEDDTAHTSTAPRGFQVGSGKPEWNSAPLDPGASFEHKFTKPGTYPYACMIHPYMEATVTVTPK